ncbi:membrane fusion protein (multidrug efflux system) [Salegentibacter sp. 24]|jgi:membrane fusion protein (multidrug efflux system)|uniref:efflux RND transporter periplasmic adaptor subunit n=1 Tax=Salegentibacter sp. 24 TaxID=2183986 RepID=UPI00105BECCF|nr:efflux RND transporter periplasmic adaptor subunit [Salegentibacter sp. 24]TDN88083.1 membrane fusion protein (multidrug efflux system) [Salegentibacter sp. 24]
MKKIIYFSLFISASILTSCADSKGGQQAQAMGPKPFPVLEVPTKTVTGYTSFPTSIEGVVNSEVRTKVSGYITDVLVDAGEEVEKGQLLFKLETESLSGDAEAARANVNAAKVEVEKLKPLVEKDIISNVQLETAKAQLAQAKANYNSISANINYANIKSPVDGYVGSINFRNGALVSPGDPTPLTTVSQTDEVYAFFSMNEKDYLNFIQGAPGSTMNERIANFPPVSLILANGEEYSYKGKIQTVSGQIDPSTGTVTFRAKFPNPNQLLSNGNSGQIRIPQTYKDVVVVPEISSYEQQGRTYVYKVQGDTIAISNPITETARVNNLIVVESGIKEGDLIVAKGVGQLRNNTPIKPQKIPFDSIANSINKVFK